MFSYHKSIFLLSLIFILASVNAEQKPGPDFKSVHRVELDAHQQDSMKHDTLLQNNETVEGRAFNQAKQVRSVINITLFVVVFMVLMLAIVVSLILRRVRKAKQE